MPIAKPELSVARLRRIFSRHKGESRDLAMQLDVTQPTVSQVLSGRSKSARILNAARKRALELLAKENK